MRIATWNVNSIRLRIELFRDIVGEIAPDVMCLQEIKAQDAEFPAEAIAEMGYVHQHVKGQKGYNGVAILSKLPVVPAKGRDWCGRNDARHASAQLPGSIELHNFYVPAGGDIPDPEQNDKFAHKLEFVGEMAAWSKSLKPGKRVLVGDLNIAPLESDVWSHKQLLKVVSHTPVEVAALTKVIDSHGWVDAVRHFIPEPEQVYTWWSYRNHTWPGSDRGRRLDHIWVSPPLAKSLTGATVWRDFRGREKPSDHVPVSIDLDA